MYPIHSGYRVIMSYRLPDTVFTPEPQVVPNPNPCMLILVAMVIFTEGHAVQRSSGGRMTGNITGTKTTWYHVTAPIYRSKVV